MASIHIRIGHNYDFVIAKFFEVERTLTLLDPFTTYSCADGCNHCPYFFVFKDFAEARFFNIDKFASNRKDSLKFTVTPLLG